MNIHLKIKVASLAAEARIIRNLENKIAKVRKPIPKLISVQEFKKLPTETQESIREKARALRIEKRLQRSKYPSKKTSEVWQSLHNHRRIAIRRELRVSSLAYGFLRGQPYKAMEAKTYTNPDWIAVERMINRYREKQDSRIFAQKFEEWKTI